MCPILSHSRHSATLFRRATPSHSFQMQIPARPSKPELRSATREAQPPEQPFSHASEHGEAFTASFRPGPQLTWGPCHLPPGSEISRLTAVERLWAVQQTLEALGFTSAAGVLLTELSTGGKHQLVWASAPNTSSAKAKHSKFTTQLLPTQSLATQSFSRMTALWNMLNSAATAHSQSFC